MIGWCCLASASAMAASPTFTTATCRGRRRYEPQRVDWILLLAFRILVWNYLFQQVVFRGTSQSIYSVSGISNGGVLHPWLLAWASVGVGGSGAIAGSAAVLAASTKVPNSAPTTRATTVLNNNRANNVNGNAAAAPASMSLASSTAGISLPEDPNLFLRVSVRNANLLDAPSCQHAFAQVEFLNSHSTESIFIHSIRANAELTRWKTPTSMVTSSPSPWPSVPPPLTTTTTNSGSSTTEWKLQESTERNDQFEECTGKLIVNEIGRCTDPSSPMPSPSSASVAFTLPQQVHLSRLPSNALQISPGQVAICPLSFLPRFPPFEEGDQRNQLHFPPDPRSWGNLGRKTSTTVWQEADLLDWFGSNQPHQLFSRAADIAPGNGSVAFRTNLCPNGPPSVCPANETDRPQTRQTFEMSTTIFVETSRGLVEVPLIASSVRENKYGLPDVIYLDAPAMQPSPPAIAVVPAQTENRNRPTLAAANTASTTGSSATTTTSSSPSSTFFRGILSGSNSDAADATAPLRRSSVWIIDREYIPPSTSTSTAPSLVRRESSDSPNLEQPSATTPTQAVTPTIKSSDTRRRLVPPREPTMKRTQNQHQHSLPSIMKTIPSRDCYDVYMRHPESLFDEADVASDTYRFNYGTIPDPLFISEVALSFGSNPHVTVELMTGKDHFQPSMPATNPDHAIRSWGPTNGGPNIPLSIPADGQQHYVVTVCSNEKSDLWMDGNLKKLFVDVTTANSSERHPTPLPASDLGYLQINAGSQVLLVALERKHSMPFLNQSEALDTVATLSVSGGSFQTKDALSPPSAVAQAWRSSSHLRSTPEEIHMQLLSSVQPVHSVPISIRNNSPFAVYVMGASLAMVMTAEDEHERLGIKISLLPFNNATAINPLESNHSWHNVISVACSVEWELFMKHYDNDWIEFHGAIIIRGTTRDFSFDEWEQLLKSRQLVDANVVLEVPVAVRVSRGTVGVIVQGTTHPFKTLWSMEHWYGGISHVVSVFYPLTMPDARVLISGEGSESISQLKSIDHHLRILNNASMDLVIKDVSISDASFESGLSLRKDPYCERFDFSFAHIHSTDDFGLPAHHKDMGIVYLRYNFLPTGPSLKQRVDKSRNLDHVPTICNLRLRTTPDTGTHVVPLVIYSGHLTAAGTNTETKPDCDVQTDKFDSFIWHRTIVGFEKLVEWFQTTKTGAALRSVLDSSGESSNDPERDGILLGRYIYGLAKKSIDLENSKLRPVLLKVGAIEHGEMETLPLFVTNHNPVPIVISIDVGEVEGMSISLALDSTRNRGDENGLPNLVSEALRVSSGRGLADGLVSTGRFRGHTIEGLSHFLLAEKQASAFLSKFHFRDAISMSQHAVRAFPSLRGLFSVYAKSRFHRSPIPRRLGPDGWNMCKQSVHPAHYGLFSDRVTGRRLPGPILISSDSRTVRRLPICWDRDSEPKDLLSEGSDIVLPPGGIARFDVNLRAPPSSVLKKDITQFLATGLVLSTDHGEVMPIFVSFEALQGHLDVTHVPENNGTSAIVRVPCGLFSRTQSHLAGSVTIPSRNVSIPEHRIIYHDGGPSPGNVTLKARGVSLFMRSSFSRDIRVRHIVSCNPWLEVVLRDNVSDESTDFHLGTNVGEIRSVVPCNHSGLSDNATIFPSFFRCVLNWLVKKAELQPHGCGMLDGSGSTVVSSETSQKLERGGVDQLIQSLSRALKLVEWTQRKSITRTELETGNHPLHSGMRSSDGFVSPLSVDVLSSAWGALRRAADLGLSSTSASLRAVVEYNFTADEKAAGRLRSSKSVDDDAHLLSIAIRNVTVETKLEVPLLFDFFRARKELYAAIEGDQDNPSIVDFDPTLVGNVAMLSLPLRNPCSVPVRVRLAVAPDESVFMFPTQLRPDESLRSNFLQNTKAPFVQTGRTITANWASDLVDHQWWDHGGAYFLSDPHGDVVRSHQSVTIKSGLGSQFGLVNPSMMFNTAFLVGCGSRCGLREESLSKKSMVDLTPTSIIGASAAAGSALVGRQRSSPEQQGEWLNDKPFFRAGGSLMTDGQGPAAFAVAYSALEEIMIPPFGEATLGPILFRPPGRSEFVGCESFSGSELPSYCERKLFVSNLLLENSLTGLERIHLRGKALWERIEFHDPTPSEGLDPFGDLEQRHGYQALVFPGTASKAPVIRELVLHNSGDVPVPIESVFLSKAFDKDQEIGYRRLECQVSSFSILNCSRAMPLAALEPGQNISIFIEHYPQCTKMKEFILLSVEFNREPLASGLPDHRLSHADLRQIATSRTVRLEQRRVNTLAKSFRKTKLVLLLGYEMTPSEFKSCKPAPRKLNPWVSRFSGWASRKLNTSSNHTAPPRNDYRSIDAPSLRSVLHGSELVVFGIALVGLIWGGESMKVRCARSKSSLALLRRLRVSDLKNNWASPFRAIMQVDPTASELQSLGREQTRHLVLGRYKIAGAQNPQCFNGFVGLSRDRAGPGAWRPQISLGKQPSGGSERARTVSDSLFGDFVLNSETQGVRVPCNVGWRIAVTRGVITPLSLENSPVAIRTRLLLSDRSRLRALKDDGGDRSIDLSEDLDSETYDASFNASSGEFEFDNDDDIIDGKGIDNDFAQRNCEDLEHEGAPNGEIDIILPAYAPHESQLEHQDVTLYVKFDDRRSSCGPYEMVAPGDARAKHPGQEIGVPVSEIRKRNSSDAAAVDTTIEPGQMPSQSESEPSSSPHLETLKSTGKKEVMQPAFKAAGRASRRRAKAEIGEATSATKTPKNDEIGVERRKGQSDRSRLLRNHHERKYENMPPGKPKELERRRTTHKRNSSTQEDRAFSSVALRPPPGFGPPISFEGSAARSPVEAAIPLRHPGATSDEASSSPFTSTPELAPSSSSFAKRDGMRTCDDSASTPTSVLASEPFHFVSPGASPALGNIGLRSGEGLLPVIAESLLPEFISPAPIPPSDDRLSTGSFLLRETSTGFDVMEFLDSILNEGNALNDSIGEDGGFNWDPRSASPAPSSTNYIPGSPLVQSGPTAPSQFGHGDIGVGSALPAMGLPSNPWANSSLMASLNLGGIESSQSRAAAYGIMVEDGSDRMLDDVENDGDVNLLMGHDLVLPLQDRAQRRGSLLHASLVGNHDVVASTPFTAGTIGLQSDLIMHNHHDQQYGASHNLDSQLSPHLLTPAAFLADLVDIGTVSPIGGAGSQQQASERKSRLREMEQTANFANYFGEG